MSSARPFTSHPRRLPLLSIPAPSFPKKLFYKDNWHTGMGVGPAPGLSSPFESHCFLSSKMKTSLLRVVFIRNKYDVVWCVGQSWHMVRPLSKQHMDGSNSQLQRLGCTVILLPPLWACGEAENHSGQGTGDQGSSAHGQPRDREKERQGRMIHD